ncbi:MAG: M1 family metallopeptidase [Nonlabens sp.]
MIKVCTSTEGRRTQITCSKATGLVQLLLLLLVFPWWVNGQLLKDKKEFNRQDSLRGSITPQREWWDLLRYDLDVTVDIDQRSIAGTNIVGYKVLQEQQVMQIDLQEPMKITRVTQNGNKLSMESEGNAHFIQLIESQTQGTEQQLIIEFEGVPRQAVNAPWDGGWSWKMDEQGNPFIATSNQGLGASVWWPCKDHMYDEPERGISIGIAIPDSLTAVANGRLKSVNKLKRNRKRFLWEVQNPINNYGVNINIGNYVNYSEIYTGERGPLDLDYYVLEENLEKAREQFKQVPKMMEAFEYWFGPYPFYEDSFKLVEVPYLGMEHQSSVTYGNKYANGYLGGDLSATGWGLKFDFIIIHEAGHEWFANNITNKDIADMWIHEGFTAYSECLYLDYHYGTKAASEYVRGTRINIRNDRPLIGEYGVNHEGSSDMYYKGANILHTLRQLIDDDEKWRTILRGLNSEFYHKTVTTMQVEQYIAREAWMDLDKFFDQYLRTTKIPILRHKIENGVLSYTYDRVIEGFQMPIDIMVNDVKTRIEPSGEIQTLQVGDAQVDFIKDFLILYYEL